MIKQGVIAGLPSAGIHVVDLSQAGAGGAVRNPHVRRRGRACTCASPSTTTGWWTSRSSTATASTSTRTPSARSKPRSSRRTSVASRWPTSAPSRSCPTRPAVPRRLPGTRRRADHHGSAGANRGRLRTGYDVHHPAPAPGAARRRDDQRQRATTATHALRSPAQHEHDLRQLATICPRDRREPRRADGQRWKDHRAERRSTGGSIPPMSALRVRHSGRARPPGRRRRAAHSAGDDGAPGAG